MDVSWNIKLEHILTLTHLIADPSNLYGVKLLKRIQKRFNGSIELKVGVAQRKKLLFAVISMEFMRLCKTNEKEEKKPKRKSRAERNEERSLRRVQTKCRLHEKSLYPETCASSTFDPAITGLTPLSAIGKQ